MTKAHHILTQLACIWLLMGFKGVFANPSDKPFEYLETRDQQGKQSFYDFVRVLGQGGFASVYEVESRETGERFAVKLIHNIDKNTGQTLSTVFQRANQTAPIVVKLNRAIHEKLTATLPFGGGLAGKLVDKTIGKFLGKPSVPLLQISEFQMIKTYSAKKSGENSAKKSGEKQQVVTSHYGVESELAMPHTLKFVRDQIRINSDDPPQVKATKTAALYNIMQGVLNGLQYLHSASDYDRSLGSLIHGDLKPDNILFRLNPDIDPNDQQEYIKALATTELHPIISDFDFLVSADKEKNAKEVLYGTLVYMSPEYLIGTRRNKTPSDDLWALSVMLYQLATGLHPLKAIDGTIQLNDKTDLNIAMRDHLREPEKTVKKMLEVFDELVDPSIGTKELLTLRSVIEAGLQADESRLVSLSRINGFSLHPEGLGLKNTLKSMKINQKSAVLNANSPCTETNIHLASTVTHALL